MTDGNDNIADLMSRIGADAVAAARQLARANADTRNNALRAIADSLRNSSELILSANRADMAAASEAGLSAAMLDRLLLDDARIEAMAQGVDSVVQLPNPVGQVLAEWQRPNGLTIRRVSVPLGVIGIVYESRPNVTADAAALCLKSGNAVILRGGSESFASSMAIYECIRAGLRTSGLTEDCVQMVPTKDREAVGYLLSSMAQTVDVVVPRGGKRLIERVQREARVPVIGHLDGICHVYVHADADPAKAEAIVLNAKMRRTGICGAAESVLIDRAVVNSLAPRIGRALQDAGCEIRGDDSILENIAGAIAATESDWSTEYLDAIISIRTVDDVQGAIAHIEKYGSGHTDCIVTEDSATADDFCAAVDSAIVLHNASTQFADGGEFGMGGEIGIATGKVHARGPVGAEQLTSYKYVVSGDGQVRS